MRTLAMIWLLTVAVSMCNAQWVQTNGPPGAVYSLAVSPNGAAGANLFAGTHGAGIWQRPLSEIITNIEPVESESPHEFSLQQNYPNPFNPSTTISYALRNASFVRLTVHDMLGRQVAQLVNEQQQAAYHDVVFRGDGLASGVYFYRLEAGPLESEGRRRAGSFTSVKKLLLLR